MRTKSKPMGEQALIEHIRNTFYSRSKAVALGIGDDCAILRPRRNHEILVTTDFSLEDRHFRRHRSPPRGLRRTPLPGSWPQRPCRDGRNPPRRLPLPRAPSPHAPNPGRSALGRRLLLGSSLPRPPARHHSCPEATPPESPADFILADIVLIGSAPIGRSLRRSGARAPRTSSTSPSSLGPEAHAELAALLASNRPSRSTTSSLHPHLYPQPRLAVGSNPPPSQSRNCSH